MHAKWKGVGGQALVHGGRGWGPFPPWKMKKNSVRGNFNLFHLCFTNEIRGGQSIHYTCKMKEGGRTCACPWWEGVGGYGGGGRGGFAPLENEKGKGEYLGSPKQSGFLSQISI